MNISELYRLTTWINAEIEAKKIPELYQALHEILQHNVQQPTKAPFEVNKNNLIEALSKIDIASLTKDQINFLRKLGILEAIGIEGINTIEDVLYKNVLDISTSAKKIQLIHLQITEGIKKSNQIQEGLRDIVTSEEFELENEVLMRVTFTGHARMQNVKDFKKWGGIWYDIGRGITMAHGATPEDIKIVGASQGSIVLELAVVAQIAGTVAAIILAALKITEKVLDVRLKAEELRSMKLNNKELVEEAADKLLETADAEKTTGIANIILTVTANIKNLDGEKTKVLGTAIKNLVDFVEKGGEVDFVMPEENLNEAPDSKDMEQLRSYSNEIRKIEENLALIEHKTEKDLG